MEHLIELKDVYKIYHMGDEDVHALDGVSLTIDKGEFVAIVGENEMKEGKVMLKNMTSGEQSLVTPDELVAAING